MSLPVARAAPRESWNRNGAATIKVMIVDDSSIARAVLSRMIAAQAGFEVAAEASDAEQALRLLGELRLDVILLDVEMPGTSGLEALPDILAAGRGARVMVVSSRCERGTRTAVQALALGAADTLPKPGKENFGGRFSAILADRMLRVVGPGRAAMPCPDLSPRLQLRAMPEGRLGCLAIGASTGGFPAIAEYLKSLPAKIGAPVLLTQHLPGLFMPFFARQIENASGRATRIATEGAVLRPDEVVLAPGDANIRLERHGSRVHLRLDRETQASGCMPSVDVMLTAVANVYGRSGFGVIMSGMGRDGFVGSRELVARGGTVIVQDRASSAVWGMPRVVAEAGLASAVSAPAELARRTAAHIRGAA